MIAIAASGTSLAAIVVMGMGMGVTGAEAEAASASASASEVALDGPELAAMLRVDHPATPAERTTSPPTSSLEPVAVELGVEVAPQPSEIERGVEVPDVSGVRLWIARKRLKDAGLTLAPRDGTRRIPTDEYADFQVASDTEFGALVPVGSEVEVQVEWWSPKYARGY